MKNHKPFPKVIRIGDRWVGDGKPAFLIAEMGANFDGSLEKAKALARAAKDAGADCAKFQTFKASHIVSRTGFARMKLRGVHGSWGRPVDEVFKDAEFPRAWHKELAVYCKKIGIIFSSAPYDFAGVDLLDSLDVPFIKIGSGDITWHEMLVYIAKKGRPMILSTGASTLAEVDEAVRVIQETGNNNLVLLQCITNYPSKIESANINVMKTYRDAYDIITGYSSNMPDPIIPIGAVARGAKVIEVHFTLSRKDAGPDHPHSMEAHEFKKMARDIHNLERALGSGRKEVVSEEEEMVIVQRRSLYLRRAITKGATIKNSDMIELRPALGILPNHKKFVAGKRAAKNLKAGDPLFWDSIE